LMPWSALSSCVKGVYCVIAILRERHRIVVGSLGAVDFAPGVYVYVGSGMAGVEQRIDRHRRKDKTKHWHIDFLMHEAEYFGSAAIPCETRKVECSVVRALVQCEGVVSTVPGFGSSDCGCGSHLIYFGDSDPEWVAEAISLRLSMLECVYPSTKDGDAWTPRKRQ